jgi:hypothetical protein
MAPEANNPRLRAVFALLFNETDFRADGHAVEGAVENGVAVEIDFAAVPRLDEARFLAGKELLDPAMTLRRRMLLDVAAHLARGVFDLADRLAESLPDRDQRVLALVRVAVGLGNDDFLTLGHGYAKIDLEQSAVAVTSLRPDDRDMAARNPRPELFEPSYLSVELRPDLIRRLEVAKGDLGWLLHVTIFAGEWGDLLLNLGSDTFAPSGQAIG